MLEERKEKEKEERVEITNYETYCQAKRKQYLFEKSERERIEVESVESKTIQNEEGESIWTRYADLYNEEERKKKYVQARLLENRRSGINKYKREGVIRNASGTLCMIMTKRDLKEEIILNMLNKSSNVFRIQSGVIQSLTIWLRRNYLKVTVVNHEFAYMLWLLGCEVYRFDDQLLCCYRNEPIATTSPVTHRVLFRPVVNPVLLGVRARRLSYECGYLTANSELNLKSHVQRLMVKDRGCVRLKPVEMVHYIIFKMSLTDIYGDVKYVLADVNAQPREMRLKIPGGFAHSVHQSYDVKLLYGNPYFGRRDTCTYPVTHNDELEVTVSHSNKIGLITIAHCLNMLPCDTKSVKLCDEQEWLSIRSSLCGRSGRKPVTLAAFKLDCSRSIEEYGEYKGVMESNSDGAEWLSEDDEYYRDDDRTIIYEIGAGIDGLEADIIDIDEPVDPEYNPENEDDWYDGYPN